MTMAYVDKILSLMLATVQTCVVFTSREYAYFYKHFSHLSANRAKICEALKNSPSDVPSLTCKCAILTGISTWLIHKLCGAKIILVASVLGAVLTATPFLSSYWCALPAMLDLWLNQGRWFAGIILFILQFLVPPYFEATVYAEMKGGGSHYLTCVAMALGMYWIGWQGSTLAPIMLCYLIDTFEQAAVSVSSNEDASNTIGAAYKGLNVMLLTKRVKFKPTISSITQTPEII